MSVRRRKDTKSPRWTARWRNSAGKWQTKDFRTKSEAKAFEAQMKSDVRRGDYSDPHSAKVQIGKVYKEWRSTQSSLKPKSLDSYDSLWRCLVEPNWANRTLAQVSRAEVKKWVGESKSTTGKKISPSRMRQAVVLLNNVLNHAVDMGLINRNPLGNLKGLLPRLEPRKPVKVLEASELATLAENCGPYKVAILLAGLTGIRWAELVALEKADFNFDEKIIRISKSISEVNGILHPVTTKSGKARELPIPEILSKELKAIVLSTSAGKPVFTGPKGGYLRRSNFARDIFSPAVKKSGSNGIRFHDLRHTAISLQLSAKADVLAVSKIAGHSKPSTTLNVYAHELGSSMEVIRKTIDGIDLETECDRFATDLDQQSA